MEVSNQNIENWMHEFWASTLRTCVRNFEIIDHEALHYNDVIMGAIAFQTTSLTIVYSTVYSGADQRKHQRSASLAFVRRIHREPVFLIDDVIMNTFNKS